VVEEIVPRRRRSRPTPAAPHAENVDPAIPTADEIPRKSGDYCHHEGLICTDFYLFLKRNRYIFITDPLERCKKEN
jgi:hypothetical protein